MTAHNESPVLAVDIGGSKILTAVFSGSGEMQSKKVTRTVAGEGVDTVVERLCRAINEHLVEENLLPSALTGIGIACAGGVDPERGVVVTPSPNLPGWYDVPLREIIEKRFGARAFVLNDASAAALGEQRHGAGKDVDNLVLITLGTGIGGGIIIDGKLYQGAAGGAGEIGHMTVDVSGPDCDCGNTGCLEVLASGKAIAREAVRRIDNGESSLLVEMVNGKIEDITAEDVVDAEREGDLLAGEVLTGASHYLGVGLVNIVNIFNPEMIIIGGGLAETGDLLLGLAKEIVDKRAYGISARSVRIVTAALGNEAGVYGAAVYANEHIVRRMA
ncbi:MAG: ROK family protein [Dehalococcoidia bacterium]|jgi:glucokinase